MTSNPFLPTTYGLAANAGLLGTPGAAIATSTTTQTIQTGDLTFTIQAQCIFGPGMWVSVTNPSNTAQWMWGTVKSYDGLGQLIVTVSFVNGGGTVSDWQIALAGQPPTAGATGPTGPTGATGASAGPVNGNAIGLTIANNSGTPNTKISVTALAATMVNSSGTSTRGTAVSVIIDLTTGTGSAAANGMDGEARGTSAWLYLYLINNGSTTSGLATLTSPLSGSPTMPSGYTYALYIGAVRVDGSGNLLRTKQFGKQTQYIVTAATNTATLPVAVNGSGGTFDLVSPVYLTVNVSTFVPPTASKIGLVVNWGYNNQTAADAFVAPNNSYAGTDTTNAPPLSTTGSAGASPAFGELTLESVDIYYTSNNAGGSVQVSGWTDYCVAA